MGELQVGVVVTEVTVRVSESVLVVESGSGFVIGEIKIAHAHAHAHASFISTTTKPLPDSREHERERHT